MTTVRRLEELMTHFYRDVESAKRLNSGNPEDDLLVRASVVGYSYNSPTQDWDLGHFEFVTSRLSREFDDEPSDAYGENSENVKVFYALALGYLLGLYQQKQLSEADFEIAEREIPGLIMLHLSSITAHPL